MFLIQNGFTNLTVLNDSDGGSQAGRRLLLFCSFLPSLRVASSFFLLRIRLLPLSLPRPLGAPAGAPPLPFDPGTSSPRTSPLRQIRPQRKDPIGKHADHAHRLSESSFLMSLPLPPDCAGSTMQPPMGSERRTPPGRPVSAFVPGAAVPPPPFAAGGPFAPPPRQGVPPPQSGAAAPAFGAAPPAAMGGGFRGPPPSQGPYGAGTLPHGPFASAPPPQGSFTSAPPSQGPFASAPPSQSPFTSPPPSQGPFAAGPPPTGPFAATPAPFRPPSSSLAQPQSPTGGALPAPPTYARPPPPLQSQGYYPGAPPANPQYPMSRPAFQQPMQNMPPPPMGPATTFGNQVAYPSAGPPVGGTLQSLVEDFQSLSLSSTPGSLDPGVDVKGLPRPLDGDEEPVKLMEAYPLNCHPRYFRLTTHAIPASQSLVSRWHLPLGAVVHPLAESPDGVMSY
jgi:protein transport protein SEC24